jgi:hypothetical protein
MVIPAVMDFLPRRRAMPPPEPDLLAESGERATAAEHTAREELGPTVPIVVRELPATLAWPDPKPLDPVVFGPPLARGER